VLLQISVKDDAIISDDFFNEKELLQRSDELNYNRVKSLSREEVFDGIC